jgi:heme-degrading monooxygenase HmoA
MVQPPTPFHKINCVTTGMERRRVIQSVAAGLICMGGASVRGREIGRTDGSKLMANEQGRKPEIARVWRGRTTRARADEYEAYNYEAGIKPLLETAMAVHTFREDRETDTEFVTISYWESIEAMTAFTKGPPTQIHHLDRDAEFLIELPRSVQILKLRTAHSKSGVAL